MAAPLDDKWEKLMAMLARLTMQQPTINLTISLSDLERKKKQLREHQSDPDVLSSPETQTPDFDPGVGYPRPLVT